MTRSGNRGTTRGRSGPIISMQFGGGGRRRRSRRAKVGMAAAIWTMFAALFGLIGLILNLLSLITAIIIVAITAIVSAIIGMIATRQGRQGSPSGGANQPLPPATGQRSRKPVAGQRSKACGRPCQMSKQPRDTCDCSCGGANHGRLAQRPSAPSKPATRKPATRRPATRKPPAKVNTKKGTP